MREREEGKGKNPDRKQIRREERLETDESEARRRGEPRGKYRTPLTVEKKKQKSEP